MNDMDQNNRSKPEKGPRSKLSPERFKRKESEKIGVIKSLGKMLIPSEKKLKRKPELGQNQEKEQEQDQKQEVSTSLIKEYVNLLKTTTVEPEIQNAWKETSLFLNNCRNKTIREGKMPEFIESHIDFEPLGNYLRPCEIAFSTGNRIKIDLVNKEKNEALKKAFLEINEEIDEKLVTPTISPISFLINLRGIATLLKAETLEKGQGRMEKALARLEVTSLIAIAYLEILEEKSEDPIESADNIGTRPRKYGGEEIAAFKKRLLAQCFNDPIPQDTPELSEQEIKEKVEKDCRDRVTSGEAVQLACIFAERALEHLKLTKKRETLFKMRVHLAHRFFEEIKHRRSNGESPNDCIVPQKPRYKTPCVFFLKHSPHERCELISLNPQSNIGFWGNQEAEKEQHAIVFKEVSKKRDTIEEIKTSVSTLLYERSSAFLITTGVLLTIGILSFLSTILNKNQAINTTSERIRTPATAASPAKTVDSASPQPQPQPQKQPQPPPAHLPAYQENQNPPTPNFPKLEGRENRKKREPKPNSIDWKTN